MNDRERSEYTLGQLSRIVGEPESVLRGWLRRGFLRPTRHTHRVNYFDFAEITRARTLQTLSQDGVPPKKLAAALNRAEQTDAGTGEIIVTGDEVAVRSRDGTITDPRGQTLLDLFSAPNASEDKIIEFKQTSDESNEPSFEDALGAEEAEDFSRAEKIYLDILMKTGPSAETCYNLGNVLYRLDRKPEAIQRYLQAVEIESDFLEAWNNLGVVMSEVGRTAESIEAFRAILEIDPGFADALFNLADTLENAGAIEEARLAWDRYLEIDPDSAIAEGIRKRLER